MMATKLGIVMSKCNSYGNKSNSSINQFAVCILVKDKCSLYAHGVWQFETSDVTAQINKVLFITFDANVLQQNHQQCYAALDTPPSGDAAVQVFLG